MDGIARNPFLKLLTLAAIALALVAGARWAPGPTSPERLSFEPGRRYVYALRWSDETRVALAADAALGGTVDVAGELVLRARPATGGVQVLELSLASLSSASVRVLGQDLPGALEGPRAYLSVEPSGRLVAVELEPGSPPLWKHVAQALAVQLQLTLPAAPAHEWQATEDGPHGRALVRYEATRDGLRRTRERYEHLTLAPHHQGPLALDAQATITLAPAGHLVSLHDDEALDTQGAGLEIHARSSLALGLARIEADLVAELPARLERRRPGEIVASPDTDRALLEQRAEGLGGEAMLAGVRARSAGAPDDPAERRWFGRAVARLRLEPALAAELEQLFLDPTLGDAGRRLVFDLLSSAGHADAQAAMVRLLPTPELSRTPRLEAELVQRFALLARVERASAEALRARLETTTSETGRRAELHALGAVAGKLARQGDDEAATRALEPLRAGLEAAQGDDDRRAIVAGLGNAGLREDVPRLEAAARDDSPAVRAEVAFALRKLDAPEARQALLALAEDPMPAVAAEALGALGRRGISPAELGALEAALEAGRLPPQADGALISLLARRSLAEAAALRILGRIAARHPDDPSLAARAQALIDRRRG